MWPEVFGLLGMIATQTSRVRSGSGIVGSYPRTAVLTEMGFATLACFAPARVLAGLGASSPIVVRVTVMPGRRRSRMRRLVLQYAEALRMVDGQAEHAMCAIGSEGSGQTIHRLAPALELARGGM